MADYKDPDNLKSRLKESYDAIAPAYNKWTADASPLRMVYVEKLIELLLVETSVDKKPLSILELGAGAGIPATSRLLEALPTAHVTANDLSSTQVALGRANLAAHDARVTWVEGDMTCASVLDFPEKSLDAVLGLYSIIHLPRAEQAVMLEKVWKWLRPGGYMLANFPETEEEGLVMDEWLHEKGWMFWSGFGAEGTLRKLGELGFEMVVGEVKKDDADASFLWVVARKPLDK